MKYYIALFFCMVVSIFGAEESRIVYLLSGPRSVSTAFVRMMESRGDFSIYCEPTITFFAREHADIYPTHWFSEGAFSSFDEVKSSLYESAKESNVFVKDMSFTAHDGLMEDHQFLQNPRVYFLALVRNPHHSIISFYKKTGNNDIGWEKKLSLKLLYEECLRIKEENPNGMKIIFSNRLVEDTRGVMKAYAKYLTLPFSEDALAWKEPDISKWHLQTKYTDWFEKAFHGSSLGSTSSYAVDVFGNPTFEEVIDVEHRNRLMDIYKENMIYYKKFLEMKADHLI